MTSNAFPKWTVVIVIFLAAVNPQMPMIPMRYGYGGPMMMPQPMPMPMPMPVPVPVGIPIPYPESTSTTTTTTTESQNRDDDIRIPIAIPIPMPHLVQIAIPGFMPPNCMPDDKNNGNGNGNRNKNCPPCPPCSCNPCTPSFFAFCSPCHLECRCKNGKENPSPREPNAPKPYPGPAFPMPIPMPAPGPVVIVPFPSHFRNPQKPRHHSSDSDCQSHSASDLEKCSEESKPHDSCESDHRPRKKKRKKDKSKSRNKKRKPAGYDIYRRNLGFMRNRSDKRDGFAEPVLTYMSRNGDIKMERRLSNDEASALLGVRRSYGDSESFNRAEDRINNVRLTAGEDSNKRSRIVVRSEPGMRSSNRRRQELFVDNSDHLLEEGRKELLFKTPDNKKISNLSVSFQITK